MLYSLGYGYSFWRNIGNLREVQDKTAEILDSVGLTDNQVNRASTNVDLGCGVRARNGDSVGYAYTEDLSLAALMSADLRSRVGGVVARSVCRLRARPPRLSLPSGALRGKLASSSEFADDQANS